MREERENRITSWRFYVCCILLVMTGIYINYYLVVEAVPLKKPLAEFPTELGSWTTMKDHFFDTETLDNLRVDDYIFRSYAYKDRTILLYIGYYKTQREGAQIHSPKHCLPGSGWFQLDERVRLVQFGELASQKLVEAVYQKDTDKTVFLYWYDMQGEKLTNEYMLKLGMIYNSILHNRSDAAFIRVSIPDTNDNLNETINYAENFLAKAIPVIDSFLPQGRAQK